MIALFNVVLGPVDPRCIQLVNLCSYNTTFLVTALHTERWSFKSAFVDRSIFCSASLVSVHMAFGVYEL